MLLLCANAVLSILKVKTATEKLMKLESEFRNKINPPDNLHILMLFIAFINHVNSLVSTSRYWLGLKYMQNLMPLRSWIINTLNHEMRIFLT